MSKHFRKVIVLYIKKYKKRHSIECKQVDSMSRKALFVYISKVIKCHCQNSKKVLNNAS